MAVQGLGHLVVEPGFGHLALQVSGAVGFEPPAHLRQEHPRAGLQQVDQVGGQVQRQGPRELPGTVNGDEQPAVGQLPVIAPDHLRIGRDPGVVVQGTPRLGNPNPFVVALFKSVQLVESLFQAG